MVAMKEPSGAALAVGRFAGFEPLGFEAGDNNWYRFVANGPAGKTDPNGRSIFGTIVPNTPQVIADCERVCADRGMVTYGPITRKWTFYSIDIAGCAVVEHHSRTIDCRCKPPPKNSGNCTPQEHAWLQVAKDAACSGAAKPRPNMPPGQLLELANRNFACASARQSIINKCYPGTADKIHRDLVAQHQDWARLALEYYRQTQPPPVR
jgi:hypothetical protein